MTAVLDLEVIDSPAAAAVALDPMRARMLARLAEPGSATTLGAELGLSRQKVNYHLHALEQHGLIELLEDRPRRGLRERVMIATARSYLIAPDALSAQAADPARADRLSTRYLIALAARMVREVTDLARGAEKAGRPLATLAIDTEIRFGSAADRAAFTEQLTATVHTLAARYHQEAAPGGRWHRLVIAAHPVPAANAQEHSHDR